MAFNVTFNSGTSNQTGVLGSGITFQDGDVLKIRGVATDTGAEMRLCDTMSLLSNGFRLRINGSTTDSAVDMTPFFGQIVTYEFRQAGDVFSAIADGVEYHSVTDAAAIEDISFIIKGFASYSNFIFYDAELVRASTAINRWVPAGAGDVIPDTVGTNDITQSNFVSDTQYASYFNFTVDQNEVKPGDSVTWTADIVPTTSWIRDGEGNQFALTGVSDTGGDIQTLSANLAACLFGDVLLFISDGTTTGSTPIRLNPPTGYGVVTLDFVPTVPASTDSVYDFDTPAEIGDQILYKLSSPYVYNSDSTVDNIAAGTDDFWTIRAATGRVSDITKIFETEGGVTAPVANAGPDAAASAGSTVTLDATGTTGDNVSYSWQQVPSETVTLSDPNIAQPTFTAPSLGSISTLTFEVTATNSGGSSTDQVTITVAAVVVSNTAPTAEAGANATANAGDSVILDGTASSDPEGDSLDYRWTQTGGTTVTLSGDNTAQPSFDAPYLGTPETLTFQLEVDDGELTSFDTVSVDVAAYVAPDLPQVQNEGSAGGIVGQVTNSILGTITGSIFGDLIRAITRSFIPFDNMAQTHIPLSPAYVSSGGDYLIRAMVYVPEIPSNNMTIIGGDGSAGEGQFALYVHPNQSIVAQLPRSASNAYVTASDALIVGEFMLIELDKNGDTVELRVDGFPRDSRTETDWLSIRADYIARWGNTSLYLGGYISDLFIRDNDEVKADMRMDKKLTLEHPIVENAAATYGANLFDFNAAVTTNATAEIVNGKIRVTNTSDAQGLATFNIPVGQAPEGGTYRLDVSGRDASNGEGEMWLANPFVPAGIDSSYLITTVTGLGVNIRCNTATAGAYIEYDLPVLRQVFGIVGKLAQFDPAAFQDWAKDSALNSHIGEEAWDGASVSRLGPSGNSTYTINDYSLTIERHVAGSWVGAYIRYLDSDAPYLVSVNVTRMDSPVNLRRATDGSEEPLSLGQNTVVFWSETNGNMGVLMRDGAIGDRFEATISVKPLLQLPTLPQDVLGRNRPMVKFDSMAQTYIQLSHAISLPGDYRVKKYFALDELDTMVILGNSQNTNTIIAYVLNGGSPLIRVRDEQNLKFDFPCETLKIDTIYELIVDRTLGATTATLNSISLGSSTAITGTMLFDKVGGYNSATASFDGKIANLELEHSGALKLDMPIDQLYTLDNAVVKNNAAVLGPELFNGTPDSLGSYWTDHGDGSFTIDAPDGHFNNSVLRLLPVAQTSNKSFLVSFTVSPPSGLDVVRLTYGVSAEDVDAFNAGGYETVANVSNTELRFNRRGGNGAFTQAVSNISVREIPAETPLGTLKQFNPAAITYQQYDDDYRGYWGESVYNFNTGQGSAVINGDGSYAFSDVYGRIQDWDGEKYIGTTLVEFDYVGDVAVLNVSGLTTYTLSNGKFRGVAVNNVSPSNFNIDITATSGNTVTISNITARKLLELP